MPLVDHAEVNAGHPFRSRISSAAGTGVVAVQMKDTSELGGILWETAVETRPAKRAANWLREGDVLLASRGNQNYAVLVAGIPASHRALAGPHWFVIRCTSANLLPAFLAWQLNRKPAQDYFRRESAGTTTKGLRRESVEKLEIAVPHLTEQRRIIALAELTRREKEMCQRLMANTELLNDGLARQLLIKDKPGVQEGVQE